VIVSEGDAVFLKRHLQNMKGDEGKGIYLLEPSGIINQRGCIRESIKNLWDQGTLQVKNLLLQVLIYQGNAQVIDQLPKLDVERAMNLYINKDNERIEEFKSIFLTALEFREDDLNYYSKNPMMRRLFLKKKISG
jgi:hypothetical protein